jgi:hypothetical protein
MKTNRQKSNWILDVLLFTGFLVSFALDWTGLSVHQWLGVFGGLFAFSHIVLHWDWFVAVTMRFFGKTSGQARNYYLLDIAILLGIYLIILTGLVISSWLDLPLTNYAGILDLHITISIVTLAAIVLKIDLHGHWITRVARQPLFVPPVPAARPIPAMRPVPVANPNAMSRRDFLKLMGVVGIAAVIAASFTLDKEGTVQAAGNSAMGSNGSGQEAAPAPEAATVESTATAVPPTQESIPTSTPEVLEDNVTTAPVPQGSASTACMVRCDKRCSYPGHCHRYQDTNGNNLCDLGECA